MTTILFLGGWLPPSTSRRSTGFRHRLVPAEGDVRLHVRHGKAFVPRYRYDQLMRLGWKVFLPFSLFWVVLTAGVLVGFDIVPQH